MKSAYKYYFNVYISTYLLDLILQINFGYILNTFGYKCRYMSSPRNLSSQIINTTRIVFYSIIDGKLVMIVFHKYKALQFRNRLRIDKS